MKNGTQDKVATRTTEVSAKATRRRFTAEYKLRILREVDGDLASGRKGAVSEMLRREGLYSSHLMSWRAQREHGELAGLASKKRGPKALPPDPNALRVAELERENARLKKRAERAEALVALQKKVSQILGIALPEPAEEP
jgi:transposase-like protein